VKLAVLATTVLVAAGALAPAAASHSIVLPFSSRPADLQLYTLVVPTEADSPTTEVALKVPPGIDFLLVKDAPGWQVKIERRDDRIDVIRWIGSAPPNFFAEFGLIARNPILEGDLPWKITQTYGNGNVSRWIGPPGSEFPASVTTLSEAAEPVDVATGLNGGEVPGSGGAAEATPDTSDAAASDSSDTIARAGAGAALALGLAALGVLLVGRRRGAASTREREE
jgi:Domain of unkown function (DUF1775)